MELTELVESVDIVEYISQFVDLEKRGDEYWGISPFTDPPEKTPSFSVRQEAGRFYCFSSGVGGSVITFIKFYNNCSTAEAIDALKRYAGIKDDGIFHQKKKLVTTQTCKKYKTNKKTEKHSSSKPFADDYMARFEKRNDKLAIWEVEGISREVLDNRQVYYDSFSDRLVYPIRNLDGKIINIGGRTVDPEWKEKKLRKYTYLSGWGGGMDVIYGLYENRKAIKERGEIIIFEGCKSVLIAETWGMMNTGALLTSHLSASQLKILLKLGVRVVFALDKDVDVTADHNIAKLKQYVCVEYLKDISGFLDEKDSPIDKGKEIFKSLYKERVRYR